MILVNGRKIETTTEGYLKHPEDWSEEVARYLSERDNVTLTDSHWEVINLVRRYFREFGITPNLRTLQKLLKEQYGEREVHVLDQFDYGDAAKQAARYAGTPRPTGCI
jgi:TusE/DsrC/DsvC family sulfur relay protein